MKTNKMLPDSSISKVWENFRKMNGIVIELPVANWVAQSNGTFTNTVSYEGFTSDEILEIDLYDNGTLTETQITEYDGYITEFNVEDGKLIAIATTKPTQSIKILARGEIVGKMVVNGGGSSDISASNVSCLDKDGQVSNVQKELDEQSKNLNVRYNAETDTVQIFYNGTWNDWKQGSMQDVFLYYYGDENAILSGGWSAYDYKVASSSNAVKAPTLAKESNKMKVSYPSNNTWYSGSIFAEKPIDLTNYSKVEFVVNDLTSAITGGSGGYVNILITTTKSNAFAEAVKKQITSNGTHVLDVSNLKGEYYCCIGTSAGGNSSYSFSVESVKLIK